MKKMKKMKKMEEIEEKEQEESAPKKLMTVAEVARRINCSVTCVYRQNDLGLMPPCIRLGRLVRWEAEDIEELIRRKRQESAEKLKQAQKSQKTKKVVV